MAEDKKKEEIAVIDITEEYLKERIYKIRGQKVISPELFTYGNIMRIFFLHSS